MVALLGWAALTIWQTQPGLLEAAGVREADVAHVVSPAAVPLAKTPTDPQALARSGLFGPTDGTVAENNLPSHSASTDLPPNLDLVLKGTVAGSPRLARAIIIDQASDQTNTYRLGEMVAGAQLREIGPKSVLLNYQGRNITLNLAPFSPADNTQQHRVAPSAPSTPKPATRTPATLAEQISTGMIEELLHQTRIEPYIVNGQPQGLRLHDMDKLAMASLLGLLNGDVLQVVNGQVLTSKQKAFQVFQKARTQPYVEIELLRGDQTKSLTFPLR